MIFYFSGTGNSLWVAKELAKFYNDSLISISDELKRPSNNFSYPVAVDEKVFIVSPIHSWGIDVLTFRFLNRFNLVNYLNQPVFIVCTCGDNCGYASSIVKRILRKKSITLTNAYSVQMPNNYVLMSGFEVDDKELERQKLSDAVERIRLITDDIPAGKSRDLYVKGKNSFIKTYLIYPLFRKQGIKRNLFYAKDACISCGLCIDICPTMTILWQDNKPKWEKDTCVQCSACINRCPERAVEYGKVSVKKGRYHHPDL